MPRMRSAFPKNMSSARPRIDSDCATVIDALRIAAFRLPDEGLMGVSDHVVARSAGWQRHGQVDP